MKLVTFETASRERLPGGEGHHEEGDGPDGVEPGALDVRVVRRLDEVGAVGEAVAEHAEAEQQPRPAGAPAREAEDADHGRDQQQVRDRVGEVHRDDERLPAGVKGLELVDGKLRMQAGYEFVSLPNGAFAVVTNPHPVPPVPTGGCKCSPLGLGVCRPTISDGIIACEPNPVCVGSCIATLQLAGTETKVIEF